MSAIQSQEDNNLMELNEISSKREHSSTDEESFAKVDNHEISMTVYSKRELKRERLKKQKQNRHEQITKTQRSKSY